MNDENPRQASGGEVRQEETITRSQRSSGETRWQLTGTELIEELRQRLKGKMWNGKQYVDVGEKMANQEGIGKIIWLVNSYINKNMQLSYFTPDQINKVMLNLRNDLADLLTLKFDEFDIDKDDLSIVLNAVCNQVWAGLNRARFGGEKEFLKDSEKRIIRRSQGGEEKSKGWRNYVPGL